MSFSDCGGTYYPLGVRNRSVEVPMDTLLTPEEYALYWKKRKKLSRIDAVSAVISYKEYVRRLRKAL